MKYIVTHGAGPEQHHGKCSYCGAKEHKADMEAGKLREEPAIFCSQCIRRFMRYAA